MLQCYCCCCCLLFVVVVVGGGGVVVATQLLLVAIVNVFIQLPLSNVHSPPPRVRSIASFV